MSFDNSFYSVDHSEYTPTRLRNAGRSLMRVALLFGSAGLALTLIIVPLLNQQAARSLQESVFPEGVDRTTTASIRRTSSQMPAADKKVELIAPVTVEPKKIPAKPVHDICVISASGVREGDC